MKIHKKILQKIINKYSIALIYNFLTLGFIIKLIETFIDLNIYIFKLI